MQKKKERERKKERKTMCEALHNTRRRFYLVRVFVCAI